MLIDWIWALLMAAGITIEAAGWGRLITRMFFSDLYRQKLAPELSLALGLAVTAQAYFVLSLSTRGNSSQTHIVLCLAGITGLALTRKRRSKPQTKEQVPRSPRLHLRLARAFSPLLWARAWPWIVLPILWTLLRLTDALLPNNQTTALAIHLYSPHRWFESGSQTLDPLHPLSAAASVWDGLYYHAIAIFEGLAPTHRHALVRSQITAQLLHLCCGQLLCLLLCARLIYPFVRAGWYKIVHAHARSEAPRERRHRLGTAASIAGPSSIMFAWIACAQTGGTPTLAMTDWAATMFLFASLSFFLRATATTTKIFALAWYVWGTAFASHFAEGQTFFSVALVCVFATFHLPTSAHRRQAFVASFIGLAASLAPWFWRGYSQAGAVFYPYIAPHKPGWLHSLPTPDFFENTWGAGIDALLMVGIPAIVFFCVKRKFRLGDRGLTTLVLFALASSATRAVLGGMTLGFAVVLVLMATLGVEYLLTRATAAESTAGYARWVPKLWFLAGVTCVALPIHLVWQNIPWALRSTDDYLAEYHAHFDAKLWSNLHLPAHTQIAWTADNQFYYLDADGAVTHESTILHDSLLRAANPAERARVLCELGFTVLAWEDHHHGPEVAGLATWARLQGKSAVLFSNDELSLLDLHCQQFHIGS